MKRIYIFGVCSAILLALSACHSNTSTTDPIPSPEKAIPVTVMSLLQQGSSRTITASGHFTTDDETILSFKVGGIVSSVLVREGDYVRKGQLLATLDVTEIEAQVQQAELLFEKSQRDYNRAAQLFADSVATKEMMQNAQTGLDIATQQLKAARFNLGTAVIKAQGNGYVLRKFVQTGQIVGAGTPILMTNNAGNSEWMLRVSLSDKDWGLLKVGDKAAVTTDVQEGAALQAYVSHKMEGADPTSGAFIVEVKLKGAAPKYLATGLFGKVTIFPSNESQMWELPYEAVLDGHAKEGFVFVTSDQKTAQRIKVEIADIRKDKILVSGGLEDATHLIVSGSAYLRDGATISIIEATSSLQP